MCLMKGNDEKNLKNGKNYNILFKITLFQVNPNSEINRPYTLSFFYDNVSSLQKVYKNPQRIHHIRLETTDENKAFDKLALYG